MEKHLNSKAMLAVWGGILGIVSVALAVLGNPGNMAFCIACFIRDIAGAARFHTAAVVQYMRPEIVGLTAGASSSQSFPGSTALRQVPLP